MRPAAFAAALLLAASVAQAGGALNARDAWTRPAAAGGTAAGFVTILNAGPADAIIGAASPIAERVEMHASSMSGGVMRMAQERSVPAPANGAVRFAPGGRHLMLVGLKRPLRLGDRAPVTLTFRSGAHLKLELTAAAFGPPAGGAMPAMHDAPHS